jgi:hypothetical protein
LDLLLLKKFYSHIITTQLTAVFAIQIDARWNQKYLSEFAVDGVSSLLKDFVAHQRDIWLMII